jgi:hypothetical protein
MTLALRPVHGGSYTQLSLLGRVPSAPVPRNVGWLLKMFSSWSGCPVDVVLCVDKETAGWCEVWTDALCAVPGRHLRLIFHTVPAADSNNPR